MKWAEHLLYVPDVWIPNAAVKKVTLLLYVLEVIVSEQGSDIGYFVPLLQLNVGRLQIGHRRFVPNNATIINR